MIRHLLLALALQATWGQQHGGTLRFCLRSEPRTLDPHLVADDFSETVRYLTSGTLVRLNRATQKVEPALAVSWKIGEGGRQIGFRLRSGVRFSDGRPFTAAHVVFTIRRVTDRKIPSPVGESFRSAAGEVSVSTAGPDQVTIRFPGPVAALPAVFDQLSMVGAGAPLDGTSVLGPFMIAERKTGQSLTLRRNPHYWKKDMSGRALPYLDSLRLDIQPNREIELLRFRRGEIHVINRVEPDLFERLTQEHPEWIHDAGASLEAELLWFNLAPSSPVRANRRAWFVQAEFRRAVSEAIEREDIRKLIYKGRAAAASGPVSRSNKAWFNQSLEPLRFDPEGAVRRLERAGFRKQGSRLVDGSGAPVEFSIVTAANKTRERMAAMIQQDLGRIGIRVNIVPLDFASLLDRMTRSLDYEACLLALTNVETDPNGQMNIWMSSAPNHQWNPAQKSPATAWEAEIDRLMLAQSASADAARRKSHFDRVQKIVVEQMPMIYLVNRNALSAASPALRSLRPSVLNPFLLWNIDEIYWMPGRPPETATGGGGL